MAHFKTGTDPNPFVELRCAVQNKITQAQCRDVVGSLTTLIRDMACHMYRANQKAWPPLFVYMRNL